MRRASVNYPAIGLGILVFALLSITASHWGEVEVMLIALKDILLAEMGPAVILILGIIWMIAAAF